MGIPSRCQLHVMKIFRNVAVSAFIVFVAAVQSANAGPIYHFVHQPDGLGNTAPNLVATIGPQSDPIDYSFSGITYFTNKNSAVVNGSLSQGMIGITAQATQNPAIPGSAFQRQEVTGNFTFDVFFASLTNDPVNVALNFDVSGEITPGSFFVNSTVHLDAGLVIGDQDSGQYSENGDPNAPPVRTGMLSNFTADGTERTVSTGLLSNVPVNTFVQFYFQFMTVQPYTSPTSVIAFGNTVSLTRFGDVFTLLGPNAGNVTSVNSVDAGIVNNQFGQVAAIPEPTSLTLLGIGAAGLLIYGRRRRRI